MIMTEKINMPVVFASDENYLFPMCVSIYSFLKNAEIKEYEIYILTGENYSSEGQACIGRLQKEFPQTKIRKMKVEEGLFKHVKMRISHISLSTMYRLILPSLLEKYDRCLYVDTDTLFLGDISELARLDMENCFCAGVLDNDVQASTSHRKLLDIPDMFSYINAGVLLMNLAYMREASVEKLFVEAAGVGYPMQDQDIINKYCYGKIKLLPGKYNCFSRMNRYPADICILHFSGGPDVHPWENRKTKNDLLWWKYAAFFQDTEKYAEILWEAEKYSQRRDYGKLTERCRNASLVYIWGYTERACTLARFLLEKGIENIKAFLDNNADKKGYCFRGIPVMPPSELKLQDNIFIINTAQKRRKEVEEQILELGIKESNIGFFLEKTDFYYMVLDKYYYNAEIEDLLLMKYGIKSRNFWTEEN